MSLINDALQRAKEAPPPKTHTLSSCQITPPPEGTTKKLSVLIVLGIVGLAFVIGMVTVLFVQGLGKSPKNSPSSEALPVTARSVDVESAPAIAERTATQPSAPIAEATTESNAALPAPHPSPESAPSSAVAQKVVVSAPPTIMAQATESSVVADASATFPALRLQGIVFRRINPSVMINNKTLFVGETVDEVTVKEIQRESVTLEWRGETKTLTLR